MARADDPFEGANSNPFAEPEPKIVGNPFEPDDAGATSPDSLQFQTFSHSPGYGVSGNMAPSPASSTGTTVASTGATVAPRTPHPMFADDPDTHGTLPQPVGAPSGAMPTGDQQQQQQQQQQQSYIPLQIGYYRPYFDVDTRDVGWRLAAAVLPFRAKFFELVGRKPDLYGPLWVATTVVFMTAVASNLASYIAAVKGGTESKWEYDFTQLTFATTLVYCYGIGLPFVLGLAFKWFDVAITIFGTICIYGYSLTVFVPAALLCIFPEELVRWVVVGLAAAISLMFLLMNLAGPIYAAPLRGTVMLLVIVAIHLAFSLTLKIYFFEYKAIDSVAKPAPAPPKPSPPPPI